MIKIKTTVPKRGFHLSIVIALVSSLISFVATPAMAAPYDGTSGDVSCTGTGSGGFFTIAGNVVTGQTGCVGSVNIPQGVTAVNQSVFWRNNGAQLTSVTLPSTLTTIYDFAFYAQPLTSIIIPGSVTSIGQRAFADAPLTNLTFLSGTVNLTIGFNAFYLARITNVIFPARPTLTLNRLAFQSNNLLQRIDFLGNTPTMTNGGSWNSGGSPRVFITSSASGFGTTWEGLTVVKPPSAPTALSAAADYEQISISFTAGDANGSSITNYKYSLDGSAYTAFNPADVTAPVVVTGLSTGTLYTIYLRGVNEAGDGVASSSVTATTLSPAAQTITFPDLSPITLGGAAPTATATASSNLTVAFTSATTAVCTVTGTTITVLTTGTCTINANQAGNALFLAATQVQKSFLISPVPVVDDGAALAAAAAKRAAEQKELTEILALIPKIGELTLSLGETTKSLYSTKCVKGKSTKFVKKGAKCPKGFVKRK
jgi:hypothetical protein